MKKTFYTLCLGILILLFAGPAVSQAEETVLRSYSLSDFGILQFHVPADWKDEVSQPKDSPDPVISFKPKSGKPFSILVTPFRPADPAMPPPDDAVLNQGVQRMIEKIRSRALESRVDIRELKKRPVSGYYFLATDRAPEEGGYKYMNQGLVRVGKLILFFTILTNEGQGSVVSCGLEMLAGAVVEENVAYQKTGLSQNLIQVRQKDGRYVLTAPTNRIALSFPQNGLIQDKSAGGGGGPDHPGYFYFAGGGSGIILSGWFEPAGAFEGREKYFATIREKIANLGPFLLEDISTREIGPWDVMTYSLRLKDRSELVHRNLRASCVREDTWIDLHISSSISRDKLIAFLKSVQIETKQREWQ